MPHLHLPSEHSDADLALAASLADVVGSRDLYVAWTHHGGSGAVPEVAAVMRDRAARGPLATLLGGLLAGLISAWRAVVEGPAPAARTTVPGTRAPRAEEPSA
jgi:hypothetical protein